MGQNKVEHERVIEEEYMDICDMFAVSEPHDIKKAIYSALNRAYSLGIIQGLEMGEKNEICVEIPNISNLKK